MKNIKIAILALLLILSFVSLVATQIKATHTTDFSGMKEFWKIVDLLEKDIEPPEDEWQALFKTPGYSYLVNVEHKDKLFRKYFPLVFMPSKNAELQKELAGESREAKYYLSHYLNVRAQRAEIIKYQRELETRDLLKDALEKTSEFLPKGIMGKFPPPTVAFTIFEPDGHADASIIVIDLLFAAHIDLTKFIGHEAHHFYLGKIIKVRPLDKNKDDYFLVRAVNQLRLEGMGDLIDKSDILDETADRNLSENQQKYRGDYRKIYYQSPEIFKKVDGLISEIADNPAKLKENAKKVWDLLPYGAHPQGYFMSKTIMDNMGKKILIKKMGNPFKFIILYNQAAAKAAKNKPGFYVLSTKTINYLNQLEKTYLTKAN